MKYKSFIFGYILIYLFILNNVVYSYTDDDIIDLDKNTTTITKCEGETAKLSCPNDLVISIDIANYGRFSVSPCNPDANANVKVDCFNENTLLILRKKCNDKNNCEFDVSSSLFGDYCPDTTKYLEAQFTCKPAPVTTTTSTTTTTTRPATKINRFKNRFLDTDISSSEIIDYSEQLTTKSPKHCPAILSRYLEWPETEVGKLSRVTCPAGTTGHAEWHCSEAGEWYPKTGADLSRCVSDWVEKLERDVSEEGEDYIILIETLKEIHSHVRRQTLIGGELIKITNVIENVVDNYVNLMNLAAASIDDKKRGYKMNKLLIESFNHLLGSNQKAAWYDLLPKKQREISSSLLMSSEKLLASIFPITTPIIVDTETENIVAKPNIIAQASTVRIDNYVVFPSVQIDNDVAYIPREALEASGLANSQVIYANYHGLGEYLRPLKDSKTHKSRKIISGIITISIVNKGKPYIVRRVARPIVLEFHIKSHKMIKNPQCVTWNMNTKEWINNGCILKKFNGTYVTCECDHMSHFAVISDINHVTNTDEAKDFVTELIVMACCIISGLFLLFSWLSFIVIGEKSCERNWIYKNLLFSMVVVELLFLIVLRYSEYELICKIITILMPVSILSIFCWLLLESIHLCYLLTPIFSLLRKITLFLIGYGIPCIITGINYYLLLENDKNNIDTNINNNCWIITTKQTILNLYGPIGIFVFITLIFLMKTLCNVMSDYTLCKHDSLKFVKKWLKLSFLNLFLISTTWIFGVLWLEQRTFIIGCIFSLFNIIIGFLILILHVFSNEKMYQDYCEWTEKNSWIPNCLQPNVLNQTNRTGPYLQPNSNYNTNNSLNGSEGMFPGTQQWTLDRFSHIPASITPTSMDRRIYNGSARSGDVSAHYQPKIDESYEYATIPYEDEQRRNMFLNSTRNYGIDSYPNSTTFSSRQPPTWKPPPPPNVSQLPLSDDSAYSDSGGSSSRSPNSGVSRSGTMLLRMDLTKNPPVFCEGV